MWIALPSVWLHVLQCQIYTAKQSVCVKMSLNIGLTCFVVPEISVPCAIRSQADTACMLLPLLLWLWNAQVAGMLADLTANRQTNTQHTDSQLVRVARISLAASLLTAHKDRRCFHICMVDYLAIMHRAGGSSCLFFVPQSSSFCSAA